MLAPNFSHRLASEIVAFDGSTFPASVIEAAADMVLDTLGVTFAGAADPDGRWLTNLWLRDLGSVSKGVTVIGRAERLPVALAASANGVAAHALDYDDTVTAGGCHVGSIVVPAVLSLAEARGSSGRAVLEAVACGYQAAVVLGRLSEKSFKGSHSAVCGLFGAIAACARIAALSTEASSHALGLGGSYVAGTSEYFPSGQGDNKHIQHGEAAGNAVKAVLLAEMGAEGPHKIFEGTLGVFFDRSNSAFPLDAAAKMDIWHEFEILSTSVKPYPACHLVVPFDSAWRKLLEKMRAASIDPFRDLRQVMCLAPPLGERFMLKPIEVKRRPKTIHQARFSLPWCLGKVALDGQLGLSAFTSEHLRNPDILSLAAIVDYEMLEVDPAKVPRDEMYAGIRVLTEDGRTFEAIEYGHSGGPSQPLGRARVREKFLDCTRAYGDRVLGERLAAAVIGMRDAATLADLTKCIDALVKEPTEKLHPPKGQ
jgi:2-methylcitrate dehydratase PrpD